MKIKEGQKKHNFLVFLSRIDLNFSDIILICIKLFRYIIGKNEHFQGKIGMSLKKISKNPVQVLTTAVGIILLYH
jgi:hypothetical protein